MSDYETERLLESLRQQIQPEAPVTGPANLQRWRTLWQLLHRIIGRLNQLEERK